MKVIVPGGAGDMGSRAIEVLAGAEGVDLVTIADRNLESARQVAHRLQNKKATVDVKYIDADDHRGLVEAMRGYDVAASALGPFYLFEARLVRAAVEAGVQYTSICDDWLAADQVITQFSEAARKRGVTAVIGLGTSPGISNIAVRFFARRMDKVRRADIYVYMPVNAGGGPAVIGHTLFIMSGRIPAWRGGKRLMVPACSEARVVEFPKFGPATLWNMGHSEPVTIPLFFPEIEEVNFFMGFGAGSRMLVWPAKMGLLGGRRRRDFFAGLLGRLEGVGRPKEPEWGAVRIDVWGTRGGRDVHEMGCGIGQMRDATGISLAVGTLMLARKDVVTKEGGVYGPEGCLDPATFLALVREQGITPYFDLEMTRPII